MKRKNRLIVETKCGAVEGICREKRKNPAAKSVKEVVEFRSIPYAQPPVGELRWKPPVPVKRWEGVKNCKEYGLIPMQYLDGAYVEPYQSDFYYDGVPKMGEDCLYLNIMVSKKTLEGDEKRPVFVWFHGGGLSNGFTYEPEADARAFAEKDIVAVSVEQRLGMFGYLALPQLTKEQGQSGNYGLMDQIMALEWIRENISCFGGDPERITLGGQSGGTTKALTQVISPQNTTPVKRLILQSGFNWERQYPTQEQAEEKGLQRLEERRIRPDCPLEVLRSMDAACFIKERDKDNYGYTVNIDGLYVTDQSAMDAVRAGKLKGISVLSGTNLGESDYLRAGNREEFYRAYREMLGELYDKYDFENLINADDYGADELSRSLASLGLGCQDSRNLMLCRVYGKMAEEKTGGGSVNYSYLFSHRTPERMEEAGTQRSALRQWSWHSSELWYSFDSIEEGKPRVRKWTDWDYDLAEKMNSYWSNFIKTGDPNGQGLPCWPPSGRKMGYMVLGDGIYGVEDKESRLEELMEEFVKKRFDF